MKHITELPVNENDRRRLSLVGQGLHQGADGTLPERIAGDGSAQVALGGGRIAACHPLGGQPLQSLEIGMLAGPALQEEPLLRAALEEGTTVEGDRLLQRCRVAAGDRRVEGDQIDRHAVKVQTQRA